MKEEGQFSGECPLLRTTVPAQASCSPGPSGEQRALRLPSSLLLYEKRTTGDISPLILPSLLSGQPLAGLMKPETCAQGWVVSLC